MKNEDVNRFLNGLARGAVTILENTGKEVLERTLGGATEGALSVVGDKLEQVSGLVEEGQRRVQKARKRARQRRNPNA